MTVPVELAGVSGILSVSGISRKRCEISPSSSFTLDATSPKGVRPWQAVRAKPLCHACGVPPPLIRGGFAAVKFYRNTVCYCETKSLCQWLPFSGELSSGSETSLPRAPLPGELASGSETERLDKGRLSSERNNAGAALYNLSVIFASLDATSPSRGGFGIP